MEKCECGNKSFLPIYAKYLNKNQYQKIYSKIKPIKNLKRVGFKCCECGIEYNLFEEQTDY